MDFDISTVLAFGTLGLVAVTWITDYFQWRGIRNLDKRLEEEAKVWTERGDIGEQLGAWLLNKEAEDKPSNLEILTALTGQNLAKSMRLSAAAEISGDVRHEKAIENRVMEAVKTSMPDSEVFWVLEKLGLADLTSPEDVAVVMRVVKRLGIDKVLGGVPQGKGKGGNGEGIW